MNIKKQVLRTNCGRWLYCFFLFLKVAFVTKTADRIILKYVGEKRGSRLFTIFKMCYAYVFNDIVFEDFFMFGLDRQPMRNALEFVSEGLFYRSTRRMNSEFDLFNDKWNTYKRYSDFYKRVVMVVSDQNEFRSFYTTHDRLVLKPRLGAMGVGVSIVKPKEMAVDEFLEKYAGEDKYLVEEYVRQAEWFAAFNQDSVNTLRITTWKIGDEIKILYASLRVGRKGRCVDNGGSGGIFCLLDVKTGKVVQTRNEMRQSFDTHPDTGVKLIGAEIPFWEDAKGVCLELAKMTSNRYGAWDLARADDGWRMIEGNAAGQFLWQWVTQRGFKRELHEILSSMGV